MHSSTVIIYPCPASRNTRWTQGKTCLSFGTGEDFYQRHRETIQFDAASDYWLDVRAFETCVQADREEHLVTQCLEEAVDLYRGKFLEGFSIEDSAAFEDWTQLVRERLERLASTAFDLLTDKQERKGRRAPAAESARRWVELQPWQEKAHQRLMRLLALSGERSAALAQYEACRRFLAEELDVEPSAETTAPYRRIRDGDLAASEVGRAEETNVPGRAGSARPDPRTGAGELWPAGRGGRLARELGP